MRKDQLTAWQVTDEDLLQHKNYKKFTAAVEHMIANTDFPHAPWTIVEANDRYFMRIKVLETIITVLETRLNLPLSFGPQANGLPITDGLKGAVNA